MNVFMCVFNQFHHVSSCFITFHQSHALRTVRLRRRSATVPATESETKSNFSSERGSKRRFGLNQQRPTATNSDQQRPTATNSDQQRPNAPKASARFFRKKLANQEHLKDLKAD